MELMLDTANLEKIKVYQDMLPITGVTTNPSIIKAEGKVDFFAHLKALKALLKPGTSLHVQVVSPTTEGMLKDAAAIREALGEDVYIKVPVNAAGVAAIKELKAQGYPVTATTIYTRLQGYLALMAGADYLAVYYNRVDEMDGDANEVIAALRDAIDRDGYEAQVLGASYRTSHQAQLSYESGAHAVTINPDLILPALTAAHVQDAAAKFDADWASVHGDTMPWQMK